jgi:hypothetical protein
VFSVEDHANLGVRLLSSQVSLFTLCGGEFPTLCGARTVSSCPNHQTFPCSFHDLKRDL